MYIISSCLIGVNCRYNATSSLDLELKAMVDEGTAIAVCPEVLAGMPTPREACEIQSEFGETKLIGKSGKDYTQLFNKAAIETLRICKDKQVTKAILKSRSPSCGYGKIYDGRFSGKLIEGNGLTADLLHKSGIVVCTDETWTKE